MTADTPAAIIDLRISRREIGELLEFARALGPVLKMLEPETKTKVAMGMLTLLAVMHRAEEA